MQTAKILVKIKMPQVKFLSTISRRFVSANWLQRFPYFRLCNGTLAHSRYSRLESGKAGPTGVELSSAQTGLRREQIQHVFIIANLKPWFCRQYTSTPRHGRSRASYTLRDSNLRLRAFRLFNQSVIINNISVGNLHWTGHRRPVPLSISFLMVLSRDSPPKFLEKIGIKNLEKGWVNENREPPWTKLLNFPHLIVTHVWCWGNNLRVMFASSIIPHIYCLPGPFRTIGSSHFALCHFHKHFKSFWFRLSALWRKLFLLVHVIRDIYLPQIYMVVLYSFFF